MAGGDGGRERGREGGREGMTICIATVVSKVSYMCALTFQASWS